MATTATIESITLNPDGTGSGINYLIQVLFNDSVSGFNQTKNYTFPVNTTIASARSTIQSDLNGFKTLINQATALQSYVGTVLT